MADPEILPKSRRRAKRAGQRSRRRGVIFGAALVVVALVVGGLVVTDVIGLPGDSSTSKKAAARGGTPTTTTTLPQKSAVARHRAIDGEDPMRLWIAGDSLAGSVGPALGELTAATGVVQPQYDSRVSSGLLNPNFYNWPRHAAEELERLDPEVVVFLIGTNDAAAWSRNNADEYRLQTEVMMRQLARGGREVYWIGPPVLRDDDYERGAKAVTLIAESAAAGIRGVTYVDAHELFADEDGEYQQSFEDQQGDRQVMRAGDGVHFSADGADYISRHLFLMIDREWRLLIQADPENPKRVRESEGSTQVAGTYRAPSSGSGSSSGSSGSGSGPATTSTSTTTTTTTLPTETSSTSSSTTTTTTAGAASSPAPSG